tara:strand:- start:2217 stop:2429 length:213 start_codon:yes stop_codon:yes gene_type:complete
MTESYGSVQFYAEQFSDILADVDATCTYPNNPNDIIQGFYKAFDDWMEYHEKQAEAYSELKLKVKAALDG